MRLTAHLDSATTTISERVAASLARRGLAGGRSRVIGLLVYELGSSYFNQLIRGIDAATAQIGYDLMLYTTHARREMEAQHAAELASGPADASGAGPASGAAAGLVAELAQLAPGRRPGTSWVIWPSPSG